MAIKSKKVIEDIVVNIGTMAEIGNKSNVLATMVGDYLVLVIDTSQNLGLSSTGKMNAKANTSGFREFPDDLYGNVYIGRKV